MSLAETPNLKVIATKSLMVKCHLLHFFAHIGVKILIFAQKSLKTGEKNNSYDKTIRDELNYMLTFIRIYNSKHGSWKIIFKSGNCWVKKKYKVYYIFFNKWDLKFYKIHFTPDKNILRLRYLIACPGTLESVINETLSKNINK